MMAIRKNPNLRSLFRLNYIFGIWIPENLPDRGKRWTFKAWEIIAPVGASIILYLIMKFLLSSMVNFRVTSLCQPVITFLVYVPALTKNAYLLMKKDSLINLFKTMEDIVAYPPFKHRQGPFIAIICRETKKTLLFLSIICVACVFITLATFTRFNNSIKNKMVNNASAFLTDDERVTSEIISVRAWTQEHFAILSLNALFSGIFPLKNVCMDCLMFLCHNFVVHQLHLLQQCFHQQLDAKKKIAFVDKPGENGHDQWIIMFHKIRKYEYDLRRNV
jgi:hypothetical protein